LLARRRLIAAIIGRAGNDHSPHPVEDFFTLREWQAAKIVRQMPGKSSPFCGADVAEIVTLQ